MSKKLRFYRVLLINPPGVVQSGYTPSPLGILYLSSYLREKIPHVKVDIIDASFETENFVFQKILEFKPDLVGLSVMTPGRIEAARFSAKIKQHLPDCKIVLGGVHPTLMWSQMMVNYPVFDFIIRGEGEETLLDLVKNKPLTLVKGLVWRKDKKIISNPDRPLIQDLDSIPFPAWDLIDPHKYPPRGSGIINGIDLEKEVRVPIIFSRGCMGACTFCSSWRIWKGYRIRSAKNVFSEVKMLVDKYNFKHFVFQDDTLTGSRKEMIKFCQLIIKHKLHLAIIGCTRVDKIDLEMLKLMKQAGFYELSYGIETGSPSLLKKINKNTDIALITAAARITKKSGIRFTALMMSNLPEETEEDKKLSSQLIKKINPHTWSSLGEVWIFPGTVLYELAKNAGLIADDFWLSPRPYYIYRGGIGDDPIQWDRLLDDWDSYGQAFALPQLPQPSSLSKLKSFIQTILG